MKDCVLDDLTIENISTELEVLTESLINGVCSHRVKFSSDNPNVLELQRGLNQVLELLELKYQDPLEGDTKVLNKFIEVFGAFATRDFTKTLTISDEGTVLDAIAAGINMLGQELEDSTVSKNELEVERNRLNESQEIAKIADWELYINEGKMIYSKTFQSILELESTTFKEIFKEYTSKIVGLSNKTIKSFLVKIKNEKYIEFENIIKSRNESVKYLLNIITHIYDDDFQHIGYKGIVQDITTLKEYQNKLKYQREVEKLIADISSRFVKNTKDFATVVTQSLKQCTEFFNVDRTYFLLFSDEDFVDCEIFEYNNDNVNYNTKSVIDHFPDFFETYVHLAKKGRYNKVFSSSDEMDIANHGADNFKLKSFVCIPVSNAKMKYGVFGMDCIVNKREWTSEELNELEIITNIISDAIYRNAFEKELIIARKKAEESDALKSAFLANISHEIRTPMNGILGFAELLKTPNLSGEKQNEFIDIIGKSGQRMLNTIGDIISMSRIDTNQERVVPVEVDIVEMVRFTYNLFKCEAEKVNLNLNYIVPEYSDKIVIITDKEKVYAILSNLVKNALKFTHEGSIEFGFFLDSSGVTFFVRDTGIGISKEKQDVIFERFVQADLKINRGHEGSGLGLAISKAYISMLNGKLWCESEKGIGSTFFFSLCSEWRQIEKNDTSFETFIPTKSLVSTILIVEDNSISRSYLKEVLLEYCSNILCAVNGKQAVEICNENLDISLVLIDIKMAEMDGYSAAKIIKESRPKLPIFAQTAYSLDSEIKKFSSVFDEYLTKPIERSKLLKLIFLYLDND